jgi:transcription initiation factor TFIIIB Brf1 subunit/transcription initiation factor TFIIB
MMEMEEEVRKNLQEEKIVCARCGLIIPYVFKKGPRYTCPSFTVVEGDTICYRCYHLDDFA